jgi:hypothetical protein
VELAAYAHRNKPRIVERDWLHFKKDVCSKPIDGSYDAGWSIEPVSEQPVLRAKTAGENNVKPDTTTATNSMESYDRG